MVSKEEVEKLKKSSHQNETKIFEFIKGKEGGGATIKETAEKLNLSPERTGQILTRLYTQGKLHIVENGKGEYIYYFEE